MKAILIARVSTEEQKEAGNSLPGQIARLEKYCKNKDFKILQCFSFDESAYKNQRDEFDRILDFVIEQKDKIAVCVDKVDRLSRNMFDKRVSLLYEKALVDQIELHFVSDGQIINSRISAAEKFQFGISLGLAKYYSDAISDNVKRAIEQKLRNGEWLAKAPFGYKNITLPDGKKDVIIDEFPANTIRKVFELYATEAYSMDLLAEKLKKDYGINILRSFIDKALRNHFYYGVMVVKGKMYNHKYPPLISKDLFDKVQDIKAGFNKKRRSKYAGMPYIYRGLIRCNHCDLAITPEKHKGYVYYHCTEYKGKHNAKWLREEEITRQLSENIFKKLQFPKEFFQEIIDTLDEVHKNKIEFHERQFDKLIREQKELTKIMDNLYVDKLRGRITESEYDKFFQQFSNQMNDVNIQLDNLKEAENNYYITAKLILDVTSKVHELFMSSEVDEKRQIIRLVLQNLKLDNESLVWEAHKPFDLILNCVDRIQWRP